MSFALATASSSTVASAESAFKVDFVYPMPGEHLLHPPTHDLFSYVTCKRQPKNLYVSSVADLRLVSARRPGHPEKQPAALHGQHRTHVYGGHRGTLMDPPLGCWSARPFEHRQRERDGRPRSLDATRRDRYCDRQPIPANVELVGDSGGSFCAGLRVAGARRAVAQRDRHRDARGRHQALAPAQQKLHGVQQRKLNPRSRQHLHQQ